MARAHFNRYEKEILAGLRTIILILGQLMLQTAPILLLFPPSEGPYAKPDGQPKRLDFNTG